MRAVFDLEADGLLDEATKVWCASFLDIDSGKLITSTDHTTWLLMLSNLEMVVGHNLTGYDFPLIEKLYDVKLSTDIAWCFDTFEASQVLRPDRPGGHSVDAWGQRMNMKKVEIDDWLFLPIERYIERCEQDVRIEHGIYLRLLNEMGLSDYRELFIEDTV